MNKKHFNKLKSVDSCIKNDSVRFMPLEYVKQTNHFHEASGSPKEIQDRGSPDLVINNCIRGC